MTVFQGHTLFQNVVHELQQKKQFDAYLINILDILFEYYHY